MNTPPDPLDHLLDHWSHVPAPPPRLAADVWQKIATEQRVEPAGWSEVLEGWFGRPAITISFVAACAMVGLFVAEMRISHLQRERNAQLARSYLLLIDPLLTAPAEEERR
jgi:hypothetical protein